MLAFFMGSDIHQNPQELTRTHKKNLPTTGVLGTLIVGSYCKAALKPPYSLIRLCLEPRGQPPHQSKDQ